jgi:acetyl esterase
MANHRHARRGWTAIVVGAMVVTASAPAITDAQPSRQQRPQRSRLAGPRVSPTHADVAYGEHPQQKIDIYLAESDTPMPLVLYIHGGGFRGGSKRGVYPKPLLDAGISLAAIEYRFVQHKRLPAAHHDCRRAIQFLRHHAQKYNFDKARIGAYGGSAGAQLCMYLAFHDDMANAEWDDPIARESTRLTCVATSGGQTTMDFAWWHRNVPGYDQPHRDISAIFDTDTPEGTEQIVKEISALSLISKDDPPIFMSYGMKPDDPVPTGGNAQGWKVHHVIFGVKLKEKMDAIGVEADLQYPGARTKYASRERFLIKKLTSLPENR